MYSAGPIGLWSVIEEGIGIVAGSMPALRPLLSLPIFGGTRTGGSTGNSHPDVHSRAWAGNRRNTLELEASMKLDTLPSHQGEDSGSSGPQGHHASNSSTSHRCGYRRSNSKKRTTTAMGAQNGTYKQSRISREDSDGESQKHILKETRVTISSETAENGTEEWTKRRINGWNQQVSRTKESR